jgi:hypothetical protein
MRLVADMRGVGGDRSKKRDPKFLGKMDHSTCVLVRVGVTE